MLVENFLEAKKKTNLGLGRCVTCNRARLKVGERNYCARCERMLVKRALRRGVRK